MDVSLPNSISIGQNCCIRTHTWDSFIEANLLIMCCCLSTLRRFFKHFAPRLIGESSSTSNSKSRSRGFSNNNAQRTFGSGGAKRTLDTIMHTNNNDGGIPLSSFDDELDKGGHHVVANGKTLSRDSDSEEAILFERSVQVTYENAPQDNKGDVQSHQPKIWTGRRV
jgi:hypothetical protein